LHRLTESNAINTDEKTVVKFLKLEITFPDFLKTLPEPFYLQNVKEKRYNPLCVSKEQTTRETVESFLSSKLTSPN
jgi:hypothetical protein